MKLPYKINSNGKIIMRRFNLRPYSVIDAAKLKLRLQIMQAEDEAIFRALDNISLEDVK